VCGAVTHTQGKQVTYIRTHSLFSLSLSLFLFVVLHFIESSFKGEALAESEKVLLPTAAVFVDQTSKRGKRKFVRLSFALLLPKYDQGYTRCLGPEALSFVGPHHCNASVWVNIQIAL